MTTVRSVIENTTQVMRSGADESEIQRSDLCAQYASQPQQQWSPEPDPREGFWRCASASSEKFSTFSERIVPVCLRKHSVCFRTLRRNKMATSKEKRDAEHGKGQFAMNTPPIVSQQAWAAAHQQLLVKEKALTRSRDALAAERRRMPWLAVDKKYEFDGPKGRIGLLDLFEGRRQLIVYRAFFEPGVFGWPEHACRGCSLGADQVAHLSHLNARDTTLAYASRAPQADIARLKARMGWKMPWYTITDGFDVDFGVDEWHGHNVFFRDGDKVFRTY